MRGQRPQRRAVRFGTHADHLAVGAVHLPARSGAQCRNAASISASEQNARPASTCDRTMSTALDPALGPHRQRHPVRMIGTDVCG